MKLEVGMYVRTKNNGIKKIKGFHSNLYKDFIIVDKGFDLVDKKEIIKANNNIIDLIEVGDYVNGMQVIAKDSDNRLYVPEDLGEPYYREFSNGCFDYTLLDMEHFKIKSIVTKEQFESMQYKVD